MSKFFLNLPLGKWGILITIMLLLVVAGSFLDWAEHHLHRGPDHHPHRQGPWFSIRSGSGSW